MYSRDDYLAMFMKLNNILMDGLAKDKDNERVKEMISLNDKMFLYTNQLFNEQDVVQLENRLVYKKLHNAQVELETIKLNK
jgi:hypothetical protein